MQTSVRSAAASQEKKKQEGRRSPGVVELLEPVFEHLFFFVLFQERVALAEAVELVEHALEQLVGAGAISACS